jgi:hypothetical protein
MLTTPVTQLHVVAFLRCAYVEDVVSTAVFCERYCIADDYDTRYVDGKENWPVASDTGTSRIL